MLKRVFAKALAGILPLFLAVLLTSCAAAPPPAPPPAEPTERLPMLMEMERASATIYYATLDKKYLLPLNVNINATKEVARVAMEKLLAGPPTDAAAALLPPDTKLLDLYSSKSTVYVNVTRDIFELPWAESALAVDAILNTILPLAEGYTLQLLVEGQVCARLGSVDIGMPLSLSYINPDAAARELIQQGKEQGIAPEATALTYYLADSQAMFWVPQTLLYQPPEPSLDQPELGERLELELSDEQESLPAAYGRAVVLAMLAPQPEDSSLSSPFWPGTELLDLWVEDNIAYVDFSRRLIGYGGGTAAESMMLSCLCYSLTSIPGISAVQILIEGGAASLPEGIDISHPLTPSVPVNAIL